MNSLSCQDSSRKVTFFDDEMKVNCRFVPVIGKTKSLRSILNLYKTIQKAITEERITRKNSAFHGIISDIEDKLLRAINLAKSSNAELIHFKVQDKFKRMKAFHPNISISSNLPSVLSSFDFVFIDSVNEALPSSVYYTSD